ncbi:MAG TPA: VWA domain-containing protein [Acidobacteriaceae bacterium]|nr:VWA domain-containing protein [Acidobacteriaceae bacterium]
MNLSRISRWAGPLLGAATIALAAGAQSPQPQQPQQPQTPTSQPSTTNPPNPATPAQQTPGAEQQPEPPQATETLQLFSREVDLFFAVTDKHGSFVNGLQQQNFGLLDDGRPPERIIRFVQQTNLPLRVGIMIDTSSSIRQRFAYEQQAAIDFLLQVMHPVDRAFVEGFDVQIDIEQDYTNRVDLLDSGISRLRPGGGTALYDSLYKTCRDQMLTLKQSADVRKMMVLVSDGDDDYSRATEDDAIKMCQRAETIVYTISTNTGPSRDKGDDTLLKISDATGGRAFFPKRMEDVSEGFQNIEAELRSQYALVYVPAGFKPDGSFRTIYLQSLDPRYVVRAKKGYFAPRPPE